MSTRATLSFYDDGRPLVSLYKHWDGYPRNGEHGFGKQIADWMQKVALTIGVGKSNDEIFYANGMGCLAAKFIADFKSEPGDLYVVRYVEDWDIQYSYVVDENYVRVYRGTHEMFNGTWGEFQQWIWGQDCVE